MTAHDVMEVTTMPRAGSASRDEVRELLDLELDAVDVDAAFADLVLADDELVAREFDAIVAAEFGEPPIPVPSHHDQAGGGPMRPGPRAAPAPRSRPGLTSTAARRRNRQRSPPRGSERTGST